MDFKIENTADVDPETWNVQYLAISPWNVTSYCHLLLRIKVKPLVVVGTICRALRKLPDVCTWPVCPCFFPSINHTWINQINQSGFDDRSKFQGKVWNLLGKTGITSKVEKSMQIKKKTTIIWLRFSTSCNDKYSWLAQFNLLEKAFIANLFTFLICNQHWAYSLKRLSNPATPNPIFPHFP